MNKPSCFFLALHGGVGEVEDGHIQFFFWYVLSLTYYLNWQPPPIVHFSQNSLWTCKGCRWKNSERSMHSGAGLSITCLGKCSSHNFNVLSPLAPAWTLIFMLLSLIFSSSEPWLFFRRKHLEEKEEEGSHNFKRRESPLLFLWAHSIQPSQHLYSASEDARGEGWGGEGEGPMASLWRSTKENQVKKGS